MLDDYSKKVDEFQTLFKNIKTNLIQSYPNYKLNNDKTIYLRNKQLLNNLFSNLHSLETTLQSAIKDNFNLLKTNNKHIESNKLNYKSLRGVLKNKISENNSGTVLKIDKYNENIEEYFKTYFYIFSIILMGGFLYNQIKN
jgi:hypothetical protein